ncbi:MAG TPA: YjgN family protein [Rhizomicrobium sp.]|jgi:uncharacterized membrane protein YjgN (DUF898 family)|nr:YjgN family protein [Rhizomicrobium sp.]
MGDVAPAASTAAVTPEHHRFEFTGSGGEYFRIWIVNIVLTVLTLGIYSAWAKVRTSRYFYGNTKLAGHAFDYHASPVRILIGRLIAVGLLLGYSITVQIQPLLGFAWTIVIMFATPWLVVSSLRFAARNSSYRNVRFNFTGTMGQAAWAYIAWPIFAILSLGTLVPLARRARDYFFVNNHTFGGKPFHTQFTGWSIYAIHLLGMAVGFGGLLVFGAVVGGAVVALGGSIDPAAFKPGSGTQPPAFFFLIFILAYLALLMFMTFVLQLIQTLVFNLVVSNTRLDGKHQLGADLSAWDMTMLVVGNLLLLLFTLGFYYPWARVRIVRYQMEHMSLAATTGLDEFTSEAIATQGAIGEEIAGFFDLGIGI